MILPHQTAYVIAIAGTSGAGKTSLVKQVAALLDDAVTFYFDDYSEYPDDIMQWLRDGADLKQWHSPKMVEDLRALKLGKAITPPELAHKHRQAIGEVSFNGVLKPARFIIVDEPFGRERPGMNELVDFVVGLNTPLDIALARKLLRDIDYHLAGVFSGDLIAYIKDILLDYPITRELYLAAGEVAGHHADLAVDGAKPIEELAREVVIKIEEYEKKDMSHRP
jgi:uridine kinase